ncbi:MAG: hypothetical protein GMKNLPBB_00177 [Myxococcota bacterium]|nr:hypothetical protein [Myxococcota bacterium]
MSFHGSAVFHALPILLGVGVIACSSAPPFTEYMCGQLKTCQAGNPDNFPNPAAVDFSGEDSRSCREQVGDNIGNLLSQDVRRFERKHRYCQTRTGCDYLECVKTWEGEVTVEPTPDPDAGEEEEKDSGAGPETDGGADDASGEDAGDPEPDSGGETPATGTGASLPDGGAEEDGASGGDAQGATHSGATAPAG